MGVLSCGPVMGEFVVGWRLQLSDAGSNKSRMETNVLETNEIENNGNQCNGNQWKQLIEATQWQEQQYIQAVKDEDDMTDREDPNNPKIRLKEL